MQDRNINLFKSNINSKRPASGYTMKSEQFIVHCFLTLNYIN